MAHRATRRFISLSCAGIACAFLAQGCALGPAAKDVTKSTIRGSYDEIDAIDPAQQDRVVRKLMDSSAVHDAAHDLFSSAVTGTFDGLTEAERSGRINALVDASLTTLRKEGDTAMKEFIARGSAELAPVLRSLVRELVTAVSSAMRDVATHDLPLIIAAVMDSTMRAFAIAASTASNEMRASAKSFVEQDLGPIMGSLSEQVAAQAIVGVREGLHKELNLNDPQVRDGMREVGLGLAEGIAKGTPVSPFSTTFAILTFVFGSLLLVAVGAIVALYTRQSMSTRIIALLAERLEGTKVSTHDPRAD